MRVLTIIATFLISANAIGSAQEADAPAPVFQGGVGAKTVFPLFLGVEANALLTNQFEIGLGLGFTPGFYSSTIGSVAASISNNAKYKNLVEAAMSSSSAIRLHLQYNFRGRGGWRLGLAGSRMSTEGTASIDSVLGATSGNDFTNLKNLLTAAGKSTDVTMGTSMLSLELYGGYSFQVTDNMHLSITAGFLKLFAPSVTLTTALPDFNASTSGKALLNDTESDIETILRDYGYSPTAALGLVYWF